MMRTKVKNVRIAYRTRSELAGAKVQQPAPRESARRVREDFYLDDAGYFRWSTQKQKAR